jgi:hypothetical protein
MVVNFKAHGISRDTRKLARTLTLIKKKNTNIRAKKVILPWPFSKSKR